MSLRSTVPSEWIEYDKEEAGVTTRMNKISVRKNTFIHLYKHDKQTFLSKKSSKFYKNNFSVGFSYLSQPS